MPEPADAKPLKVLFVCMANCCRSQMAEGLARHLAPEMSIFSAGLVPAGYVHKHAAKILLDKGVDISGQVSKGLDEVDTDSMDVVIAMGGFPCSDFVSRPEGKVLREWEIPDPIGHGEDFYRQVRDQIEAKIRQLFDELGRSRKNP